MNKNITLSLIVFSQFACTSIWFAGNAIIGNLIDSFHLGEGSLFHLTTAVQLGFISGTLVFAILTISDRYSPSKVFFISAIIGAICNLLPVFGEHNFVSLFALRFLTGVSLAGIYPVGMKIAADHHEKGLGKALGFLVGALVLGTAFPHLVSGLTTDLPWKVVLITTSLFAVTGGALILVLVPDGPFRKHQPNFQISAIIQVLKHKNLRAAANGYFGHMWELYTFWAFVPVILGYYASSNDLQVDVPLLSFVIIGSGMASCIIGGFLTGRYGSASVAFYSLLSSCLCCLVFPLMIHTPAPFFIAYLIFWGLVVIADSPQFSSLVATYSTPEYRGSALTITNSIGFSITIISIQLIGWLTYTFKSDLIYTMLAVGPVFGLISTSRLLKRR